MRHIIAIWGFGHLTAWLAADPMEMLAWIAGDWHIPGEKTVYFESWERVSDSLFAGKGLTLRGSDTVFYEAIEIRRSGETITYSVYSPDQNQGGIVDFLLVSHQDNTYIFENTEHDYPQRIIYRHPADDSLSAYIEGYVNGNYKRSDFPMIRKK